MTFTGSSVSGNGYSYSIYRKGNAYAVALALGPMAGYAPTAVVPAESMSHAHEIGQRFTHCFHQWNKVQARERAFANGFAILGG